MAVTDNRIKDIPVHATTFSSDDYIVLDGTTSGTRNMAASTLLSIASQAALSRAEEIHSEAFDEIDLNDPSYWEQGGVQPWTANGIDGGTLVSDSQRLRTKPLRLTRDSVITYTIQPNVNMELDRVNAYCYDERGNYLGYAILPDVHGMIAAAYENYPSIAYCIVGTKPITGVSPVVPSNLANLLVFSTGVYVERYARASDVDKKLNEQFVTTINMYDPGLWMKSGVVTSNGDLYSDVSDRLTTQMLELKPESIFSISLKSGVSVSNINFYLYAADKSYIGLVHTTSVTGGLISNLYTAYPTTAYIRIGLVQISGATVAPSNISNIAVIGNTMYTDRLATKQYIDEKLSSSSSGGSSADLSALYTPVDLNTSSLWGNYAIDGTGYLGANNSRLSTIDFLALAPNTEFDYTPASGVSLSMYFYAYDSSGTIIVTDGFGLHDINAFQSWVAANPTAKKFRLSMIPTGSSGVSPSNLSNIVTFNKPVNVLDIISKEYVDSQVSAVAAQIQSIDTSGFTEAINLNSSSMWEDGGIDTTTGTSLSNSSRIHTVMLDCNASSVFTIAMKSGYSLQTWNVMAYDADGTYKGHLNAANVTGRSISAVMAAYPTASQFRIEVRLSTGTASAANVTNIATFENTIYRDTFATKSYVDAIVSSAVSSAGSGSGSSSGSGSGSSSSSTTTVDLDLNDTSLWDTLTVDGTNGYTWNSGANGKRLATIDMYELSPTTTISYTMASGASMNASSVYLYTYEDDETYIQGASLKAASQLSSIIEQYPNAKKFRLAMFSITPADGATLSAENLDKVVHFTAPVQVVSDAASSGLNGTSKQYVDDAIAASEAATDAKIDAIIESMSVSYNLNSPDMWLDYGVETNTGRLYTDSGRVTTKVLELHDDAVIKVYNVGSATSTKNLYFFAADGSYLGSQVGFPSGKTWAELKELYNKSTAKTVRIGILSVQNVSTVSADNITNILSFDNTLWTDKYVSEDKVKEIAAGSGGAGNPIFVGKKWYACGDSFTDGMTDTFDGGLYDGQNKAYPQYIGIRNPNFTVVNFAKSGSTIAYKEGTSTAVNCFTYPSTGRLYQIPQDVDYITLKFGINDEHQSIPLGTINDSTNATEYGAWNLVLQYLITNYPYAHVGIIITNGCENTAYPQAAKDCAEKWGVPVLDENFDYNVPLLHRVSGKPNICSAAHALRLQQFRYSENNTHPSPAAQEYESAFVETFLARI